MRPARPTPTTNQAPYTTVAAQRMLAKKTTNQRWADEWECAAEGRVLHRLLLRPEKATLHQYRDLKHAVAATVFQLRTGKIGLNDHPWSIRAHGATSPLCNCGTGDRQTVRHVLLHCTLHRALREEVWGAAGSRWEAPRPPTDLREIWKNGRAKTAAIFMLRKGLLGRFTRSAVEDDPPRKPPRKPPKGPRKGPQGTTPQPNAVNSRLLQG